MSIVQSLNPGTPDGFTNEDMMHLLDTLKERRIGLVGNSRYALHSAQKQELIKGNFWPWASWVIYARQRKGSGLYNSLKSPKRLSNQLFSVILLSLKAYFRARKCLDISRWCNSGSQESQFMQVPSSRNSLRYRAWKFCKLWNKVWMPRTILISS